MEHLYLKGPHSFKMLSASQTEHCSSLFLIKQMRRASKAWLGQEKSMAVGQGELCSKSVSPLLSFGRGGTQFFLP